MVNVALLILDGPVLLDGEGHFDGLWCGCVAVRIGNRRLVNIDGPSLAIGFLEEEHVECNQCCENNDASANVLLGQEKDEQKQQQSKKYSAQVDLKADADAGT